MSSLVRRILARIAWWCVFFALWSALTGEGSVLELASGAIIALAATALVARAHTHGLARFRPRGRWLVQVWTLPLRIVRGWVVLLAVLARRLAGGTAEGALVSIPFHSRGEDARSWARRALIIAATSLPPDSIVLGLDGERMLVHRLRGAS